MWPALPASVDYAPGGALHETDESFTVELDLPGVDKKNISIDMSDRRLTVHGERVVKEREGVLRHTTRVTAQLQLRGGPACAGGREEGHGRPCRRCPHDHHAEGHRGQDHAHHREVVLTSMRAWAVGEPGPLDQRPLRLVERPSRARRGGGARPGAGLRRVPDRPAPR